MTQDAQAKIIKNKTVIQDLIYRIEIETSWIMVNTKTGYFETVAKLYSVKNPKQPEKYIYEEKSTGNNHADITRWARATYCTGPTD